MVTGARTGATRLVSALVTGASAEVTGARACVTGASAEVTGASACVTGASAEVTSAVAVPRVPVRVETTDVIAVVTALVVWVMGARVGPGSPRDAEMSPASEPTVEVTGVNNVPAAATRPAVTPTVRTTVVTTPGLVVSTPSARSADGSGVVPARAVSVTEPTVVDAGPMTVPSVRLIEPLAAVVTELVAEAL